MPAELLSLETTDTTVAIQRCADALLNGRLLVLPTETVYGLGALASNADAVARLCFKKERRKGHALALAVSGYSMAKEYVPALPPVAERLARRFWPGPLTIVAEAGEPDGKLSSFSQAALDSIMPQTTCGFRTPQNDFLLEVIRAVNAPIVLTSANISGQKPATTAQEALESLGDRVDLIVDGGPAAYGKPSTVVKLDADGLTILREGAVSAQTIEDSALKTFLFVCTANLSRSPMAESLARKAFADRLKISTEELRRRYRFCSAGTNAPANEKANPFAQRVLSAEYNLSLENHRSRRVDDAILRDADVIFTMEETHRRILQNEYPDHADRILLLAPNGDAVSDPYGGTETDYSACARRIADLLQERLEQMISD